VSQAPAHEDRGFGIVEVIIAMFLLAMIAVAILPALWQGIRYSSEQSSVATATRFLNSLIEEARAGADCATIAGLDGRTATDGKGAAMTSAFSPASGPTCASGSTATFTLEIRDASASVLAATTAIVYVP
jgi:prepilin-type N-terminal cleavage/methylation domain-containing protein